MKYSIDLSIRIYICIYLIIYGIGKVMHIQFESDNLSHIITKNSTGKEIVWFFFSYSYAYSFIIGVFQIVGALLLIPNKTKFIGYFILLPIMMNIILLNYFFSIEVLGRAVYYFFLIILSICLNVDTLKVIIQHFLKISFNKSNILIVFAFLIILFIIGQIL